MTYTIGILWPRQFFWAWFGGVNIFRFLRLTFFNAVANIWCLYLAKPLKLVVVVDMVLNFLIPDKSIMAEWSSVPSKESKCLTTSAFSLNILVQKEQVKFGWSEEQVKFGWSSGQVRSLRAQHPIQFATRWIKKKKTTNYPLFVDKPFTPPPPYPRRPGLIIFTLRNFQSIGPLGRCFL